MRQQVEGGTRATSLHPVQALYIQYTVRSNVSEAKRNNRGGRRSSGIKGTRRGGGRGFQWRERSVRRGRTFVQPGVEGLRGAGLSVKAHESEGGRPCCETGFGFARAE